MMDQDIIALRQRLHSRPELAGYESGTADLIRDFFIPLEPDQIISGLGGYGLAVIFKGREPGPTVMLRCELDALPIQEINDLPYRSQYPDRAHKCGHDGHMTILAAVGQSLAYARPDRGRVVLLFQPAEETGSGAAAVLADPYFSSIRPDFAFALHNLPGFPLGQVVLRTGSFNCASRGMAVTLEGRTAHAAQPETGLSPAPALSSLLSQVEQLPGELQDQGQHLQATVVGARLGEKAFGTAPGRAELWTTLRSTTDIGMAALVEAAEDRVQQVTASTGLTVTIDYQDIFPATVNADAAVAIIEGAVAPLSFKQLEAPFRWSEDFGHITALCSGALFGIGAGEQCPALHNPDYDFPDRLIVPAAELFGRILDDCLKADQR